MLTIVLRSLGINEMQTLVSTASYVGGSILDLDTQVEVKFGGIMVLLFCLRMF